MSNKWPQNQTKTNKCKQNDRGARGLGSIWEHLGWRSARGPGHLGGLAPKAHLASGLGGLAPRAHLASGLEPIWNRGAWGPENFDICLMFGSIFWHLLDLWLKCLTFVGFVGQSFDILFVLGLFFHICWMLASFVWHLFDVWVNCLTYVWFRGHAFFTFLPLVNR